MTQSSVSLELACGGTSNAVSSSLLNIFDSTKTRLQLQKDPLIYKNLPHAISRIHAEEGLRGLLTPGLSAGIIRELTYSSFRFGMYPSFKRAIINITNDDHSAPSFFVKFAAGVSVGFIGSSFANPTDVVKIRMQGEAGKVVDGVYATGLAKGSRPMFRNVFDAFRVVYREGGLSALYRGVGATAVRAACISGGQLSSYDHTKQTLRRYGMQDGFKMHLISSVVAGLVATTLGAPADFLKTRILGSPNWEYRGMSDCLIKSVKSDGIAVLFRGWTPAYFRIAPHFIIALPLFEQMRRILGLGEFV